jgi:hypothetical protein
LAISSSTYLTGPSLHLPLRRARVGEQQSVATAQPARGHYTNQSGFYLGGACCRHLGASSHLRVHVVLAVDEHGQERHPRLDLLGPREHLVVREDSVRHVQRRRHPRREAEHTATGHTTSFKWNASILGPLCPKIPVGIPIVGYPMAGKLHLRLNIFPGGATNPIPSLFPIAATKHSKQKLIPEAGELARDLRHGEDHGVLLPLEPVFEVELAE